MPLACPIQQGRYYDHEIRKFKCLIDLSSFGWSPQARACANGFCHVNLPQRESSDQALRCKGVTLVSPAIPSTGKCARMVSAT
jgi:hypothetical protein